MRPFLKKYCFYDEWWNIFLKKIKVSTILSDDALNSGNEYRQQKVCALSGNRSVNLIAIKDIWEDANEKIQMGRCNEKV